MARTTRRVRVVGNPARRRRPNRRRRNARHMSAKQIKYFGTPAQKAALKRSRSAKRASPKRSNATRRHKRHTRRTRARRNIGEILSLTLGNPPKARKARKGRKTKGATMAATHKRRRRRVENTGGPRRRRRTYHARHRRRTMNAATPRRTYRRRRRSNSRRSHRRRGNAGSSMGFGGLLMNALWTVGGGVATSVVTQMVLGASNQGVMGYLGNAATAFGLSFIASKLMKQPQIGKAILAGGALQITLRAINDYTPYGSLTAKLGMGDYMVSNWVTPQRYVDPLHSAQVQIPPGWAPQIAAPAGAGMNGVTNYGSLYDPNFAALYN